MKGWCIENKCIKCCLETRMPLSNKDIEHIKRLGFNTKTFIKSRNGWIQLKNKNGKCIFHNGVFCTIYKNRPKGCKLYPIIYDKYKNCAIHDKYCPHIENFRITKRKTDNLLALILTLEHEKAQRRSKANI